MNQYNQNEIENIILVGGSTRLKLIKESSGKIIK